MAISLGEFCEKWSACHEKKSSNSNNYTNTLDEIDSIAEGLQNESDINSIKGITSSMRERAKIEEQARTDALITEPEKLVNELKEFINDLAGITNSTDMSNVADIMNKMQQLQDRANKFEESMSNNDNQQQPIINPTEILNTELKPTAPKAAFTDVPVNNDLNPSSEFLVKNGMSAMELIKNINKYLDRDGNI